jgi:hypothetical protein
VFWIGGGGGAPIARIRQRQRHKKVGGVNSLFF